MKRTTSLLLPLLVLAAYAWRVHDLTRQSLWRDEVDAIYFATRPLAATLSMFVNAGQNGPLYFLALRPWFSLVGTHAFALRYPSALADVLSVPLLWQVARRLLPPLQAAAPASVAPNPDAAEAVGVTTGPAHTGREPTPARRTYLPLVAAAFLAANPYQLWYSQEGKMYTLITLLVLLATWLWLQGIDRGGWQPWLAYLAVMSVALYCHLLIILLFPVHCLWFLIAWPQSKRHWRGYGLALAGLTLPYLPMVWWQWDLLTAGKKMTGFSFTPLAADAPRPALQPKSRLCAGPRGRLGGADLLLGCGRFGAEAGMRSVGELHGGTQPRGSWRRGGAICCC